MKNIYLAIISGLLLILLFPKFDFHYYAWVALIPIFIALYESTPTWALIYGLITGFISFAGILYWITIFGYIPWATLALFQATFIIAFAGLWKLIARKKNWCNMVLLPALLWPILEWLRSLGQFGFTWADLAYSQYKVLPLIQICSFTGPYGLSFLIILVNSSLTFWIVNRQTKNIFPFLGVSCLLLTIILWGSITLKTNPPTNQHTVAIIQGGIAQKADPKHKLKEITTHQSLQTYIQLTQTASLSHPFLILWPETAITYSLIRTHATFDKIKKLAQQAQAYLFIGSPDATPDGKIFNSAFLISPQGQLIGRYDKVKLVPYGEYVPKRKYFRFLKRFGIRDFDFTPGKQYKVFQTPQGKFGIVICFESIFPYISRQLIKKGAQLLFVITNDSWFKHTYAAYQHAYISVFRAIENRVYLVRGATTGISCIIDPYGRILQQTDLFQPHIIIQNITFQNQKTAYTRFNDWFVYLCLITLIILAIHPQFKRPPR